ncbi:hypothetical protein CYMTET_15238 [Cymbomonas tetramitiformis]|uniref:Uncharacterized protein n=1 Tax=Cymbomonas tetramitiformis TaxID=36881 RepID=A0AAE0GEE1_9CHLO|nr:hypothetical protein CYMTET_15238 [Cymbomonas tetramitiformis]
MHPNSRTLLDCYALPYVQSSSEIGSVGQSKQRPFQKKASSDVLRCKSSQGEGIPSGSGCRHRIATSADARSSNTGFPGRQATNVLHGSAQAQSSTTFSPGQPGRTLQEYWCSPACDYALVEAQEVELIENGLFRCRLGRVPLPSNVFPPELELTIQVEKTGETDVFATLQVVDCRLVGEPRFVEAISVNGSVFLRGFQSPSAPFWRMEATAEVDVTVDWLWGASFAPPNTQHMFSTALKTCVQFAVEDLLMRVKEDYAWWSGASSTTSSSRAWLVPRLRHRWGSRASSSQRLLAYAALQEDRLPHTSAPRHAQGEQGAECRSTSTATVHSSEQAVRDTSSEGCCDPIASSCKKSSAEGDSDEEKAEEVVAVTEGAQVNAGAITRSDREGGVQMDAEEDLGHQWREESINAAEDGGKSTEVAAAEGSSSGLENSHGERGACEAAEGRRRLKAAMQAAQASLVGSEVSQSEPPAESSLQVPAETAPIHSAMVAAYESKAGATSDESAWTAVKRTDLSISEDKGSAMREEAAPATAEEEEVNKEVEVAPSPAGDQEAVDITAADSPGSTEETVSGCHETKEAELAVKRTGRKRNREMLPEEAHLSAKQDAPQGDTGDAARGGRVRDGTLPEANLEGEKEAAFNIAIPADGERDRVEERLDGDGERGVKHPEELRGGAEESADGGAEESAERGVKHPEELRGGAEESAESGAQVPDPLHLGTADAGEPMPDATGSFERNEQAGALLNVEAKLRQDHVPANTRSAGLNPNAREGAEAGRQTPPCQVANPAEAQLEEAAECEAHDGEGDLGQSPFSAPGGSRVPVFDDPRTGSDCGDTLSPMGERSEGGEEPSERNLEKEVNMDAEKALGLEEAQCTKEEARVQRALERVWDQHLQHLSHGEELRLQSSTTYHKEDKFLVLSNGRIQSLPPFIFDQKLVRRYEASQRSWRRRGGQQQEILDLLTALGNRIGRIIR